MILTVFNISAGSPLEIRFEPRGKEEEELFVKLHNRLQKDESQGLVFVTCERTDTTVMMKFHPVPAEKTIQLSLVAKGQLEREKTQGEKLDKELVQQKLDYFFNK